MAVGSGGRLNLWQMTAPSMTAATSSGPPGGAALSFVAVSLYGKKLGTFADQAGAKQAVRVAANVPHSSGLASSTTI